MTVFFSPRSKPSAASKRIRSRSACSWGLSPPPCAYRIAPEYREHVTPDNPPEKSVTPMVGLFFGGMLFLSVPVGVVLTR
ncbi:hypothetical protein T261_7019 [Streptomyces lydicus]|nr:hypothetical protein T261_7019 [Streptomyces lydicus]